ncbi:sensor histidine kinase [Haliangium sp.]|uniref:sensor histidine kinase n=1 Tax=Haliangium sp. TaxID=2663208 RepID=UPI003D0CA268
MSDSPPGSGPRSARPDQGARREADAAGPDDAPAPKRDGDRADDGRADALDDVEHADGLDDVERAESLVSLHRRIEELTFDIGAVLHANTSTLLMAHHALDVAIRALGPSPYQSETPTDDEIDDVLREPARQAARAIEKLIEVHAEPGRPQAFDQEELEELGESAETLADHVAHIPIAGIRASALRSIACRVQDLIAAAPPHTLPKQVLRQVRHSAREVERCTAVASFLQARSAILQMDYTIRSFREFVTTDLRRREPTARLRLARLIESAHRQLADYAQASNVEVKRSHQAPGAEVLGVKRELVRAFGNLLHNAIKYSWRRDKSVPAWVEIKIWRDDGRVCVAFSNWGVPISQSELDRGMIFELGYRGKWSVDRGRLGTGIGLTDARAVVEKHRGTLTVKSHPARPWGPDDPDSEEYYRQPFLTTVTICLPELV